MNKFIFAIIISLLFVKNVSATLITVNDQLWDVTFSIGTFEEIDAQEKLQEQVWWGDLDLAKLFADTLGYVNDGDAETEWGPMFAVQFPYLQNGGVYVASAAWKVENGYAIPVGAEPDNTPLSWAHASLVDVPEPSTLAIFALGIMGLASCRFKKQ